MTSTEGRQARDSVGGAGKSPWNWRVSREVRSRGCGAVQAGGGPSSPRGSGDRRPLSLLTSGLTKGRWEGENGPPSGFRVQGLEGGPAYGAISVRSPVRASGGMGKLRTRGTVRVHLLRDCGSLERSCLLGVPSWSQPGLTAWSSTRQRATTSPKSPSLYLPPQQRRGAKLRAWKRRLPQK